MSQSLSNGMMEDHVRRGVLDSLPCWGFLFLLVTRRSPRTGLPRPAYAGGKHWGVKGDRAIDATSQKWRDIAEQRGRKPHLGCSGWLLHSLRGRHKTQAIRLT